MEELLNFDFTLLYRLIGAFLLGGLIGWERGGNNHEAGLRTHIIVCLGAASVMIISESIALKYNINEEVMRMGAQVISGIGFLGAGSIIIDGNRIRGITTAAGIWTTACVGLAVGAGYYIIALALAVLMLITMLVLKPLTNKIRLHSMHNMLKVEVSDKTLVKNVLSALISANVSIIAVEVTNSRHADRIFIQIELDLPQNLTMDALITELSGIDGVNSLAPVVKG